MQYIEHSNLLLQKHRCGFCAEQVSSINIMREDNCAFCGRALTWHGSGESSNLFETLQEKWKKQKLIILTMVGFTSLFSGQIPMLQSLIMIIGVVSIHVLLIRKPLKWLPTGRRVCAKMNIKLIGSMIAVFNLFVNVLIWPFACVNGLALSVLGIFNTLIFVQLSMKTIQTRLTWEQERKPFGIHDWFGPVLVLSFLLGTSLLGMLTVYFVGDWMLSLNVPFVEMNLGEFLFDRGE